MKKQAAASPFSLSARIGDKRILGVAALLLLALSLNAVEMDWGLSGRITWQPDSIEGEITLNHLPLLFKQWRHKYPRGQFLLNWAFYRPVISHWQSHPVAVEGPDGKIARIVLTADRVEYLAAIARWITAVMSLGTVLAVFLLTFYVFGDYLAAWCAGLALSVSALFLFHSGIGHVDVPFTFWFAWASFFCLRAAAEHRWRDYVLAGLSAGYAVCTKEGYFGYLAGLAVVYCVFRFADRYQKTKQIRTAVASLFSLRVLAAVAAFLVLFIVMNGFFNFPKELIDRMDYWKNDTTFHYKRPHLQLLQTSLSGLYTGLGWPLLSLLAAGIFYCCLRYPKALALVLIPVIVFYLLTVTRIRFVADRFFIPGYVCFAAAIGKTAADWMRCRKVPAPARYGVAGLLLGLSLLLCIGMKLEMKQDTRLRLLTWFEQHVDRQALVGSGMKRWYAPPLRRSGYQMIDGWHSEGVRTAQGIVTIYPDFLIMSQMFPCSSNYKNDASFKDRLYNGQAGYEQVAHFEALYFPPSFSLFSIATWPYKPVYWISPTVEVFQKQSQRLSQNAME